MGAFIADFEQSGSGFEVTLAVGSASLAASEVAQHHQTVVEQVLQQP